MINAFVINYGNLSNEELVKKIRNGDSEGLQILILRHMPLVHRLAVRYARTPAEVEDFEQDALIALYGAVNSFSEGQAAFSFFASLCIRRALIGERRSQGRRRRIPQELISSLEECEAVSERDPEALFVEKESLLSLTDTIRVELSPLEYRVLKAFLAGSSYAVIAASLGISVKSVDNALRRIRVKLRKNGVSSS